jgi:hypothetical protein
MLRQPAVLILMGLLAVVFALPAGAAIFSYQLSGSIGGDGGLISDVDAPGAPTADNVSVSPDPFPNPVPFTISFDLDDSVTGVPAGSNGSSFSSAITNLVIDINGSAFYSSSAEDVSEFDNGSNHQWSFFTFGGPYNLVDDSVDIEDDMGNFVDSLQLMQADLFLLDTDSTLFSQNPPELVAFNGNEFEFGDFDLTWRSVASDLYLYSVTGDIESITVSAVPLPSAFWLFGSALLGLSGIAKRKKA